MSICPESGLPCPKPSLLPAKRDPRETNPNQGQSLSSLAECEEFAKIQPEEAYREPAPFPIFNLEDAVQGLVSLYALGYGGRGIDHSPFASDDSEGSAKGQSTIDKGQFPNCPEDIRFWSQVDALCQIGEKIQNGEEVSINDLPKISRVEAQKMFHLTMEAQVKNHPAAAALMW